MRKSLIFLFTVLCFASIFINRASWLLCPYMDGAVNDNITCSIISVPDSSNLANVTQHLVYDVPDSGRILSEEKNFSGNQRRVPLAERSLRLYGKQLMDFCFLKSGLNGLNTKSYIIRLASNGLCLNISDPNDFFIFSLRKIRV